MMRYGSVYVITNKHTGEQYVGQTRKLVSKRWDSHWRTAICEKSRKAKFQKVLLAHGKDAFTVEEVYVAFDAEDLNAAEIKIIAELNPVYNSSRGGRGLRPIIVSEETRKKRSEAAKARWADPEWKAKTVQALKGKRDSDKAREQAKLTSRLKRGTKASEETKAKISEAGKKRNAELVSIGMEKTRMIYVEYAAGSKIDSTCKMHKLSKQAFYKYAKLLHLPLLGCNRCGVKL
jgi:group I intron endonuclease